MLGDGLSGIEEGGTTVVLAVLGNATNKLKWFNLFAVTYTAKTNG